MIERKILPPFTKLESTCLDSPFVTVKTFDADSMQKFIEDCQKVLNTQQHFLPILIDSFGGEVYTVFGMLDFLSGVSVPVITYCQTKAMSAGALLFSAGIKRVLTSIATIMIHEPSAIHCGKNEELQNSAKEIARLTKKLWQKLDKNTSRPNGYWKSLSKNAGNVALFLNSTVCLKHNLATHIGTLGVETEVKISRKLMLDGHIIFGV